MSNKLLLSAMGGLVSPDFIQHYQSKGYKIIGIDASKESVGRFFCDEFYQVPLAKNENIEEYLNVISNIDFDLFLPWVDEELLLLVNNNIPQDIMSKIVISDMDSVKLCLDKVKFHKFCTNNNILVPKLKTTTPAFVRRRMSRGSKGATKIKDTKILKHYLDEKHLVTEYIDGVEYTIDVLVNTNGDFIFSVPRERTSTNAVSVSGKIVMDDILIQFSKDVVDKFNFIGPINIQVIRESKSDKIYLIEVNPRLAGTSILSIKAGFDLIDTTYNMIINKQIKKNFKINDKIKMNRYLKGYFYE